MNNYTKAIGAFIGSLMGLLAVFGIHTGILSDPTAQNALATILAVIIPTAVTYFVPSNKSAPAPVPVEVHAATAAAAASAAAKAAQDAAAALASFVAAPKA